MTRLLFSDDVQPERRRRLEYAFGEILCLGGVLVPGERATVGYGVEGDVTIRPSDSDEPTAVRLIIRDNPPNPFGWPAELYSLFADTETRLPGRPLYSDDSDRALVTLDGDRVHLAVDPLATAWHLLAQEEERRFPERRDEHGRLSLGATALPPETFRRPRLEEWGRFFAGALAIKNTVARFGRHPGGADWSLVLTHDVDSVSERSFLRALRLLAAGFLKFSKARLRAAGRMFSLLGAPDRHRQLDVCVAADSPARATYLFHAGRRGRWDPEYKLDGLGRELTFLKSTSQEVGVHYGYETAGDYKKLGAELSAFERATGSPPTGGRAHYLRLRGPDDLRLIARTGLDYDSSLGFPDGPGYRVGTGGPYRVFDTVNGELTNLYELPLAVMDGALFKRYGDGNVDVDDAWVRVRPYLDSAREAGAALCILWHQRVFGPAYPGWGEVYERILAYARENGAWCGPAGEFIGHARAAERLFAGESRIVNNSNIVIKITLSSNPEKTVELHPGETLPVS
ncbi:MAG: hypothetical protein A2Y64_01195 [Candidatus Coatesbacteria bacterium RBG_13_66_14]|uniref:Uncharacterized protein n=1 Tax=Candidatus Coatesbacteria bacterium RBG_13_66_14 TaxID=1817816 RepID=A0A1F5FH18_9BACT|nr:MAG: hypothetical protein A2Y64_01195 [Candidatus Coatesbacteria bacterium RBG_13_66_14]